MKKSVIVLLVMIVFTACKNEAKKIEDTDLKTENTIPENVKTAKQNDGLTLFSGQFVYFADAAVLQTKNDVYGVIINEKMHELDSMAKPFKVDPTDYVTVQLRGKIIPKPKDEEGWPYRIDIKEIESVKKYESKDNEVIKLSNTTE
ncbi:hypothetical protein AB9K26_12335 [Psychroserpens sp. XS_ASV72]|uniref:hypothetical protein n=1 Tax=Psychroserpens sp. XS_ASV72 TaxID=3241293 RepID=UPI00351630B6